MSKKEHIQKFLFTLKERRIKKEKQRQALIELMRISEELGLYDV